MNNKPLRVEISGTTLSGKTTLMAIIMQALKEAGYRDIAIEGVEEVNPEGALALRWNQQWTLQSRVEDRFVLVSEQDKQEFEETMKGRITLVEMSSTSVHPILRDMEKHGI